MNEHLSDDDLERYHLGMVKDDELAALEEHYLGCSPCAERAEEAADYGDDLRAAITSWKYDLDSPLRCRRCTENQTF
jgi:hypothetical protein